MKALTKLKDDARKHEQKEEWDKAVQLYLEVIRTAEEGEGDSELPLYNRVGDLYVRMGRPTDAVAYYEKAADRYAEAGLFNNAIALCNKALRYLPNRTELLRKLGQFSASQGFITEARRWYLEYAERKLKEGALDDAFQALDDFASVHEDADVREMLGRQLLAHNRREHALQELKKAYDLRVAAGQTDASVRLMDEILTIEPGAFSGGGHATSPAPEPVVEPSAFDAPQIESWAAPAAPDVPAGPTDLGLETPADAFGGAGSTDPGLIDLSDLKLPGLDTPEAPAAGASADTPLELPVAESGIDAFDFDAALADINAEVPEPSDVDDALTAPIDLDAIDLGGGRDDLDVGLVDVSASGLEPDATGLEDALIEPLPLIDTGAAEEGDTFDLPLLEVPGIETTGSFDTAEFETAFESEEIEPLPLLGEEDEEQAVDETYEPLPEIAFDGPAVEPGSTEAEPGFEVETPGFETETPESETGTPEFETGTPEFETGTPDAAIGDSFEGPDDFDGTPDAEIAQESAASFDATAVDLDDIAGEPVASSLEISRGEDNPVVAFEYEPAETVEAVAFEVERIEAVESDQLDSETADEAEPVDFAFEAEVETPDSVEFTPPEAARPPTDETFAAADPFGAAAEPELDDLEAGVAYDFDEDEEDLEPDWTETFAAAQEFAQRGETAAAIEELLILHESLGAGGMYREALQVIEELVRLEPGSVSHLQQRVEYATKVGDTTSLVRAYLDLADRLARSGSTVKANAIYQRVLDIEPTNAVARNAAYTPPPPPVQANDDGYVDLFSLLTEDDEAGTRFVVEEKPPTGDEERDFADMLSQFKQKLADHVPFDDSASHYDLGLAFKEMGLVDEAIAEFQIALKGGQDRLKIYEELGQCFLLKQQYNIAITILNRALNMGADDGDLVGVYYHIGRSYEEMGQRADAKVAYERVVGVDISFKDAAQRLSRL